MELVHFSLDTSFFHNVFSVFKYQSYIYYINTINLYSINTLYQNNRILKKGVLCDAK